MYDSVNQVIVVFGSNESSNDTVIYDPRSRTQRRMPTRGIRPPEDQHVPMAFHPGIGETVVVVDRVPSGTKRPSRTAIRAETWLYNVRQDVWTKVKDGDLPFGCGMNYNLEYDPLHDVLLLVTSEPDGPTSVWALRL